MIGFIGAGKVGVSLGRYFSDNNIKISGFFSMSEHSCKIAAQFSNSKKFDKLCDVVNSSRIIFITTPDDAITEIWKKLKVEDISDKIICHCSGSLTSEIFEGREFFHCYGYSVHPLLAVNDRFNSYNEMKNALFTVEGDSAKLCEIENIFNKCGNKIRYISKNDKPKYHAAAVMASNLIIGLAKTAVGELIECGFSESESIDALVPFMLSNISHICDNGFENALTGPIERADINTVKKHLSVLSDNSYEIYKNLSTKVLEIAKGKYPERNYSDMEDLFK